MSFNRSPLLIAGWFAILLLIKCVSSDGARNGDIPCPALCGDVCTPATTTVPPIAAINSYLLSQSRSVHEYQFNHSAGTASRNASMLPDCSPYTWAETYRGVRTSTVALTARAMLSVGDSWTSKSLIRSLSTHEGNAYGTLNGSALCALQDLGYKYFQNTLAPLGYGECFHFDWVSSVGHFPDPENENLTIPFASGTPALQNTVLLGISALALDGRLQVAPSLSAGMFENFIYVLELMQIQNLFAESPQKMPGMSARHAVASQVTEVETTAAPTSPATTTAASGEDDNPTFHPLPPVRTLSVSLEMTDTVEVNTTTAAPNTTTTTEEPSTTTTTTTSEAPNTTTTTTTTTAVITSTTTEAPTTTTTSSEAPNSTTSEPTTTTTTVEPTSTSSPTNAISTTGEQNTTTTSAPVTTIEPSTTTTAPATNTSTMPTSTDLTTTTTEPTTTTTTTDVTTTSEPSTTTAEPNTTTTAPSTSEPTTTTTTVAPATPVPTIAPDFHAQMLTQCLLLSWMRGFSEFQVRYPGILTAYQSAQVETVWNQTNKTVAQWFCSASMLNLSRTSPFIPFSIDLVSFAYNNTNDVWTQCVGLAAIGTLLDTMCSSYPLSFNILNTVMSTFAVRNANNVVLGIAASVREQRQGIVDVDVTGVCLMAARRLQAAYLPSFITEFVSIIEALGGNTSFMVQQDCERIDESYPSAGAFDTSRPTAECGGPLLSLRTSAIRYLALKGTNPFDVVSSFPTLPPVPTSPPVAQPQSTVNMVIGGAVGGVVVLVALAVIFRRVRRAPKTEVLLQAPSENLGFY